MPKNLAKKLSQKQPKKHHLLVWLSGRALPW
jgi:hypothetical protein